MYGNIIPNKENSAKNQYRKQYPDLWAVHEQERKTFFRWLEMKGKNENHSRS